MARKKNRTVNITWKPSPNCSVAYRQVGDVRGIVVHDTEGTLDGALAVLRAPGGPSAHYVIDVGGAVYQLVSETDVAYHVAAFGNSPALNRNRPDWLPPYNGNYSAVNASTVGIELVGYAAKGFTQAQYDTLGALAYGICQRWAITPRCEPDAGNDATIITHGWLQTDRTDPGPHFDWGRFKTAFDAAGGQISTGDEVVSEEDQAIVAACRARGLNDAQAVHDLCDWSGGIWEQNQALTSQVSSLTGEVQSLSNQISNPPASVVKVIAPANVTVDVERP